MFPTSSTNLNIRTYLSNCKITLSKIRVNPINIEILLTSRPDQPFHVLNDTQFVIDRRRRPPFEFHPKIAKLRESNTENENSSARIVGGFFCNYVREESSTSDGRAEKSLYSARSPFSQCSLSLRQLEFLDEGN